MATIGARVLGDLGLAFDQEDARVRPAPGQGAAKNSAASRYANPSDRAKARSLASRPT